MIIDIVDIIEHLTVVRVATQDICVQHVAMARAPLWHSLHVCVIAASQSARDAPQAAQIFSRVGVSALRRVYLIYSEFTTQNGRFRQCGPWQRLVGDYEKPSCWESQAEYFNSYQTVFRN